eukprot:GILJ01026851.1.p2 GENE.GILJ01026851.1~~GILJ01026851.1.p2  ORF type:complete len:243 (-),score=27.59 GILJ01026851.1:256-984(-)
MLLTATLQQVGYFRWPAVMTPDEVREVRLALAEVERRASFAGVDNKRDLDPGHVFYMTTEGRPTEVKQIQYVHLYHPFLAQVVNRIHRQMEEAMGTRYHVLNSQYFRKGPGAKATGPHQDEYYFRCRTPTHIPITCWVALDDVDETNACLHYAPGSHKAGLLEHDYYRGCSIRTRCGVTGNSAYVDDTTLEYEPQVLKAGDMIVHDSLTIHKSSANTQCQTRHALGIPLIPVDVWPPPSLTQ